MIQKAMNVKLNVKPLMGILVHSDFWEGPCRGGVKEEMTPEAEMRRARELFETYQERLHKISMENSDICMMKPVFVPYNESFVVDEKIVNGINEEIGQADCILLLNQRIPKIERFARPVIAMTHAVSAADSCAYLRSIGQEGYYAMDMSEFEAIVHKLWVRKAVRHTRALVLTAGEAPSWGLLSNIRDIEFLRAKYGVEVIKKPFTDIFKIMDGIDDKDAEALTQKLYENSKENKVCREYLLNDIKYYMAAVKMLEFYGCNAFSTSCVELCRSRIPQERKFVPCITHTLLKDAGIPSACEEDLNALMAMIILMYTAKRPAFMGNPLFESEEILSLHHSVPCLKMNGYDSEAMEYSIYPFTGQGFGGKIQVDFAQSRSQKVTFGRFDFSGKKMLLKTGDVLKSKFTEAYCSPYYYIQVENARDYFRKLMDFGHHQALVFGDFSEALRDTAELLGFEIVEA